MNEPGLPIATNEMESCCCHHQRGARTSLPRWREIGGWIIPSLILAVMPKCPACLAAYVALATGLGLSLIWASYLRTTAILLCCLIWILLAGRRAMRFYFPLFRQPST